MIKAIFLDFYGTVVHEDNDVVRKIIEEIADTGNEKNGRRSEAIGRKNSKGRFIRLTEKAFKRKERWNIAHWRKRSSSSTPPPTWKS